MEKPGEMMTRRNLMKGVVGAGIVTGVGMVGETAYKIYESLEDPEEPEVPEAESGKHFADGTIYNPKHVDAQLDAWYKKHAGERLFKNLDFSETQKHRAEQLKRLEQYRANYTKEGVPALMKKLEAKGVLKRYATEEAIKKSSLAHVDEINEFWRCRGIGSGASSTPTNNPSFLRTMLGTADELNMIAKTFNKKVREAGLSLEWDVRMIIASLARSSKGTNAELSNSSDDSPHTFGMGFDISNTKFDIIHKTDKTFMMLGEGDASRDAAIKTTLNYLLAQILEAEHAHKDIVLTYEPKKHHYHITNLHP